MVGLSVGGHIAYYAATQLPLAAVAVFYPGWLTDTGIALSRPEPTLALTPGLTAHGTRLLFLVGDADQLYTAAQRDQIAARLREDGVDHEMVVYPGAPHGFFCDERDLPACRGRRRVHAGHRVARRHAAAPGNRSSLSWTSVPGPAGSPAWRPA